MMQDFYHQQQDPSGRAFGLGSFSCRRPVKFRDTQQGLIRVEGPAFRVGGSVV